MPTLVGGEAKLFGCNTGELFSEAWILQESNEGCGQNAETRDFRRLSLTSSHFFTSPAPQALHEDDAMKQLLWRCLEIVESAVAMSTHGVLGVAAMSRHQAQRRAKTGDGR